MKFKPSPIPKLSPIQWAAQDLADRMRRLELIRTRNTHRSEYMDLSIDVTLQSRKLKELMEKDDVRKVKATGYTFALSGDGRLEVHKDPKGTKNVDARELVGPMRPGRRLFGQPLPNQPGRAPNPKASG